MLPFIRRTSDPHNSVWGYPEAVRMLIYLCGGRGHYRDHVKDPLEHCHASSSSQAPLPDRSDAQQRADPNVLWPALKDCSSQPPGPEQPMRRGDALIPQADPAVSPKASLKNLKRYSVMVRSKSVR